MAPFSVKNIVKMITGNADMNTRERPLGADTLQDFAADGRQQGSRQDGIDHAATAFQFGAAAAYQIDHHLVVGEGHAATFQYPPGDTRELKADDLVQCRFAERKVRYDQQAAEQCSR